jgi:signal transduction histidine kinase
LTAAYLTAGAILLAAQWSYDLVARPMIGTITGRDCVRVAAYVLILCVAMSSRTRLRETRAQEARILERRRLARDLHDGLAQDLAFIAAHREELTSMFGCEHPLVVAAERALETSRNAIEDLSATTAASAAEELRAAAAELSARYGTRIVVNADEVDQLPLHQREDVVRIAREAMVNAVKHGGAQNIQATLNTRADRLALSVTDDGCGLGHELPAPANGGHGLRMMRERAETIGGQLVVRPSAGGGTAVELRV